MITDWKVKAPQAPYYAVIFISQRSENSEGYLEMDQRMMELAQSQEGYLGYSSKNDGSEGIFISYWKDEASILKWKADQEHGQAKAGAPQWYSYYHSMICKVESSKTLGAWV